MRALYLILCVWLMVIPQGVLAQLLDTPPVSTGGNPVGTWKVQDEPIQVYAVPELVAAVSDLSFSGVITGQLSLGGQGVYQSDYITTSIASLSILILGSPLPVAINVADTNRTSGTYTIGGNTLILVPASGPPDSLGFSVSGNTMTVVQTIPLGDFASSIALVAPSASAPLAVFSMTKEVVGHSGPITADFDGSGTVDFNDFISFAQQFGKKSDAPDFDVKFDLNQSGAIDFADFISFAQQFGLKT